MVPPDLGYVIIGHCVWHLDWCNYNSKTSVTQTLPVVHTRAVMTRRYGATLSRISRVQYASSTLGSVLTKVQIYRPSGSTLFVDNGWRSIWSRDLFSWIIHERVHGKCLNECRRRRSAPRRRYSPPLFSSSSHWKGRNLFQGWTSWEVVFWICPSISQAGLYGSCSVHHQGPGANGGRPHCARRPTGRKRQGKDIRGKDLHCSRRLLDSSQMEITDGGKQETLSRLRPWIKFLDIFWYGERLSWETHKVTEVRCETIRDALEIVRDDKRWDLQLKDMTKLKGYELCMCLAAIKDHIHGWFDRIFLTDRS